MNKILDDYVNQQNPKPGELTITPLADDMEYSRGDCMGIAVMLAFFAVCWLSIGLITGWLLWK